MKPYDFKVVEPKWQQTWEDTGVFHAEDNSDKPKFYGLVEFPIHLVQVCTLDISRHTQVLK